MAQQPDPNSLIPDPNVLEDLEAHARAISSNLDMALRDLRGLSVNIFKYIVSI
jgi:hypothetical protein